MIEISGGFQGEIEQQLRAFDMSRGFFESLWTVMVMKVLQDQPQIEAGVLQYLLCGSTVYSGLVLSTSCYDVVYSSGRVTRGSEIEIARSTQALLAISSLSPSDVDLMSPKSACLGKHPDIAVPISEHFWNAIPGGVRLFEMEVQGRPVYTVHPIDNVIFRIVSYFLPVVGNVLKHNTMQNLNQVLLSLTQTWTLEEIEHRFEQAILAINTIKKQLPEAFKSTTRWDSSMDAVNVVEIKATDLAPRSYKPLLKALERKFISDPNLEIPVLINFLNLVSNSIDNLTIKD